VSGADLIIARPKFITFKRFSHELYELMKPFVQVNARNKRSSNKKNREDVCQHRYHRYHRYHHHHHHHQHHKEKMDLLRLHGAGVLDARVEKIILAWPLDVLRVIVLLLGLRHLLPRLLILVRKLVDVKCDGRPSGQSSPTET
jgi:hypothetical protein